MGLLLFGWAGTIVSVLAAIAVSFFLFGYWYPYWRRADMDVMLVYQAFLVNAGHAQDFFDHPGHLHVLLIDLWFKFLHGIGALDVISLNGMPLASDQAAFDHVWTAGVRAGRVMSLALVMSIVTVFALLLRRLVGDWRVAALATLFFAFSSGVIWHTRVMRTDLLAAALALFGLLLLLSAARSPGSNWRPVMVGVAAMLCTLGVVNKVQALFPAMAWTIVVMFFGLRSDGTGNIWRSPNAWLPLIVLAALTALAIIPAANLVQIGFAARASSVFAFPPPPFGILGLYQALIAGWVFCAVIGFALIWRVGLLETIATLLAVAAGVSIGLLSLDLLYHPQNVIEVVNPLELMYFFATWADPQLAAGNAVASPRLFESLGLGFLDVLARATYVLHTSSRATVFLQWAVIAGMAVAFARGRRLLVAQVAILLAIAWGLDTVATLRSLKLEYSVFSDPVIVVAAAWLLANLPELGLHRLAFPIGALLLAAHLALSHVEPVKNLFSRAGPEGSCVWLPRYTKLIERFPFCPPRS